MIASHYAFPGGQKPSALQAQLLPLPANVRALLRGHPHIGDLKWNKDDPWGARSRRDRPRLQPIQ